MKRLTVCFMFVLGSCQSTIDDLTKPRCWPAITGLSRIVFIGMSQRPPAKRRSMRRRYAQPPSRAARMADRQTRSTS